MLVLSYLPLFNVAPANYSLSENESDDFVKAVETSTNLAVGAGVMWIDSDDGKRLPILIFEEGDDIFEHLVTWSEDKPEDWFSFHIVELASGQVEFLVAPRFMKSIERHKRQFPDSDVDDCKVLFTPLQVRIDKSEQAAGYLESFLRPVMDVGFIDMDYLRLGDPTKLNFKKCVNVVELRLESVYNSVKPAALLPLFKDDVIVRDYGIDLSDGI